MNTQHPTPEVERVWGIFLFAVIIGLILLCCTGCVNKRLVESYGQFTETAGTEYVEYVKADDNLNEDDKAIRLMNVRLANDTVEKFKATKWSW